MGVLTLTPNIKACINTNCGKITFTDTTGLYNVSTNPGGWGAPNTVNSAVTSAIIFYTTPDGTTTELDVTSIVTAATITGDLDLGTVDITATDGEYVFEYNILEGEDYASDNLTIFSTCVVRCCVDKLWVAAVKAGINTDCGCGDSATKKAMQAEALYKGILHAASCASAATRNELLVKLQRICRLENCNCN